MYKGMNDLWHICTIRNEDSICPKWPEECEDCVLVAFYLVKLPKCWSSIDMDYESEDDRHQLATLLHAHLIGKCDWYCIFCEVERIPI